MSQEKIDTGQLVEEHSDYLLSFAMTKLNDLEQAKDLVQDTFLSAITKLHTFENRSKVRTWLTSILNRKIIDHWRRAETRYTDPVSNFFDQDDPHKHWILDKNQSVDFETIEDQMIHSENQSDLHDCIGKLPDKWQGVIASKYLEEKASEDICKDLEITSSNLWVIVHRAKLLLRDCLKLRNVR
jgi:RNA polymerase sigma-70 factor (ECF subfamily)